MPSKHCRRISGVSSSSASALAAWVLPTPASPSSSSGCGSRTAKNSAVAKPGVGEVADRCQPVGSAVVSRSG